MRQTSLMCGHLGGRCGRREEGTENGDRPGGARLEDLAHRAGAGGLLQGADWIAHDGADGGGGVREGARERLGKVGTRAQWRREGWKGGWEVFVLRRRRKKANACGSAHGADRVHLGESYKFG